MAIHNAVPVRRFDRADAFTLAPPRHWYVMLDCRFREPLDAENAKAAEPSIFSRIVPQKKMRGYFRCFGVTAPSKEAAHRLAVDDTVNNPFFLLNVSEIEIVEIEEVSRDDDTFRRLVHKAGGRQVQPIDLGPDGTTQEPIWFRDGGGYYW